MAPEQLSHDCRIVPYLRKPWSCEREAETRKQQWQIGHVKVCKEHNAPSPDFDSDHIS